MGCILCGSDIDTLRWFPQSVTSESKLIPAVSKLHVCTTCGHLQTTIDVDLERYYAEHYNATLTDEGYDEIVSTRDGSIVFRTDLDFDLMKRQLGGLLTRQPSILEYGCGHGRILSRLYKEGQRHLAAYDLSELYREPVSRFVQPESVYIGQRPSRSDFELAISFFVLEHDVDPVDSLLYLRDQLVPGGTLYLMLPNFVTNAADLACADHVNHYSPRSLRALVEACGFDVTAVDDASAIGAVSLVATSSGTRVDRSELRLASRDLVDYSCAASKEFLEYMARLEALAHALRGRRVALYGAGLYGTLVQAHLESEQACVTDVFDANPRKQGTDRLGLTVRSPDELSGGAWSGVDLVMCINAQIAASVGDRFAPYVRAVHVI